MNQNIVKYVIEKNLRNIFSVMKSIHLSKITIQYKAIHVIILTTTDVLQLTNIDENLEHAAEVCILCHAYQGF